MAGRSSVAGAVIASWALLSIAGVLYRGVGVWGLVAFVIVLGSIFAGLLILGSMRRRRLTVAAERRRALATHDLVFDPALDEQERLAAVDGLIPALGATRRHDDRYVVAGELSAPSQVLLNRARRAVSTVNASQAKRLRLLDDVGNDLILPQQLWEIARILRAQTHLQQEQRHATQGVVTPELRAVLEPQQAALERSIAAVTSRVGGLERYAHRVQEADAALRAREALANNDKYRELLAQTDDTQGLDELTAQSDALEITLARSVRDALEAGQSLGRHPS